MADRFSLSFPGRRDANDPWFRIGTLDVTTTVLTTIVVAMSMLVWVLSPRFVEDALELDASDVRAGQLWRVVTWPLSNAPSIWTVIGLAVFWLVGRELERVTGRVRFAWFLVTLTVVPGILAALLDLDAAGFRAIQFAVLLVYIAEYPFVRFMFNIPAWVLGVVFVAIEVMQLLGLRLFTQFWFLMLSLAVAALAARSIGLFQQYAWIPRIGGGGSGGGGGGRSSGGKRRTKQKRSSSQVVQGPWAPPGSSTTAGQIEQIELDMLLDKISATGMDSLSKAEKQRLNELSKRLRGG